MTTPISGVKFCIFQPLYDMLRKGMRIIVQVALSLGCLFMSLYLPMLAGLGIMGLFISSIDREAARNLPFVLACIAAVAALLASIFLQKKWYAGRIRFALRIGLTIGLLLSVTFFCKGIAQVKYTDELLWGLWIYIGPAVVAVWNLVRLEKKS